MEDDKKYWDEIIEELEKKYPSLSKYLKSSYSHLAKELFYKVFDSNDLKHILWVIRMDNDVSNETINTIQKLLQSKVKKIKNVSEKAKPIINNINTTFQKPVKEPLIKSKVGLNRYILAWFVVLGFYILTYFLMVQPIPKDSNQVVFMLFGTISTGFGTVLGFFFGSSQSSGEKDEMIHRSKPLD